MTNKKVEVTSDLKIFCSFLFSAFKVAIKLHQVVIITVDCWVCNILKRNDNNNIKGAEEEIEPSVSIKSVFHESDVWVNLKG